MNHEPNDRDAEASRTDVASPSRPADGDESPVGSLTVPAETTDATEARAVQEPAGTPPEAEADAEVPVEKEPEPEYAGSPVADVDDVAGAATHESPPVTIELPAGVEPLPSAAIPTLETPVEAAEGTEALETPVVAAEAPDGQAPGPPATSADATTERNSGAPSRPPRPRRKRRSAAERHRGAFFAKLGEMRRAANGTPAPTPHPTEPATGMAAPEAPAPEAPAPEAPLAEASPTEAPEVQAPAVEAPEVEAPAVEAPEVEAPAVEAPEVEAPAVEAPAVETPAAGAPPPKPTPSAPADETPATREPETGPQTASAPESSADASGSSSDAVSPAAEEGPATTPARAQARLAAAIERVGGVEVVQEALQPKRNEKGEPLKWAAVCCDAAEGKPAGDPVFLAWVRLASTPVREIKAQIRPPREGHRGGNGRSGSRRPSQPGDRGDRAASGGGRGQGDRRPRSGGGAGGGGGGRDRSVQDAAKDLLRDGSFRPSVRIVGLDDEEKRERERARKEKREAKRQAERERLARLGY